MIGLETYPPLTASERTIYERAGLLTNDLEYIREGYWKDDVDWATERRICNELRQFNN